MVSKFIIFQKYKLKKKKKSQLQEASLIERKRKTLSIKWTLNTVLMKGMTNTQKLVQIS